MPDLDDTIEAAAAEPKKVEVDGTVVEAHSLRDLIEAAKHLASNSTVAAQPNRGIRITKLVPPGGCE